MQATGFKLPLATYLVPPEAELPGSLNGESFQRAVEPRPGKVRADRLDPAGNRSAR